MKRAWTKGIGGNERGGGGARWQREEKEELEVRRVPGLLGQAGEKTAVLAVRSSSVAGEARQVGTPRSSLTPQKPSHWLGNVKGMSAACRENEGRQSGLGPGCRCSERGGEG